MMRTGIAVLLAAAMLPAATAQQGPSSAGTMVVDEPERALVQVAIEPPEFRARRERAEALQAAGQAAPREVALGEGAARLTLLEGEAYIAQPDADWLRSDVWKQDTRGAVSGLLLSPDGGVLSQLGRHAFITYTDTEEFSPVEDIDADWTLFELQSRAEDRLAARPEGEALAVAVTWALPPVVDKDRQVFRFLVRFSREDGGGERYSGTILKSGRKGVLVATLALAEADVTRFEALAASLEQRLDFNPGYRAEDFDPVTDRKAVATREDPDRGSPLDLWIVIGTAAFVAAGSAVAHALKGRGRKSG